MRNVLTAILVLGLTPALAWGQTKTYHWESKDGIPAYGDSVPPEAADKDKHILNEAGVTVDVLRGRKTPEEIAEERRQAELAAEQARQREKDRALLATYLSIEEIQMHRDRRVELFQAQARVTELYLKNLRSRLTGLEKDASRFRPYSDDPDAEMIAPELIDDLNETRDTIARHEQNLKRYERNEREMNARFQQDIDRFRRLKGLLEDGNQALANSQ